VADYQDLQNQSGTIARDSRRVIASAVIADDSGVAHFILDHTALFTVSGSAAYRWGDWLFAIDNLFNTGLRGGFANTEGLPNVWQVNLSAAKEFTIPRLGKVTDRVILLNIFDRTNMIRPPNGIGVFQSAYGPRLPSIML